MINEKPERMESFEFKNKEAQVKFKTLTTNTKDFTNCFQNENITLLNQVENWRN